MPVANYFLWCLAERPKEAPESAYKKSWQPNSLQRMAGIAPEKNSIKKTPLLAQWSLIYFEIKGLVY